MTGRPVQHSPQTAPAPGHQAGLGRGWAGKPPPLSYKSVQKPSHLLNLHVSMERDAWPP